MRFTGTARRARGWKWKRTISSRGSGYRPRQLQVVGISPWLAQTRPVINGWATGRLSALRQELSPTACNCCLRAIPHPRRKLINSDKGAPCCCYSRLFAFRFFEIEIAIEIGSFTNFAFCMATINIPTEYGPVGAPLVGAQIPGTRKGCPYKVFLIRAQMNLFFFRFRTALQKVQDQSASKVGGPFLKRH